MDQGYGVLVAAPTGAGKTVVGEYGVWLAIAENKKCFYTTPIKALSNQKYYDLVAKYGGDRVGLLTGDQSVNSDAQILVMTTEVLRNMIYAGSSALTDLSYVVMDEVHYLADRFRGPVWEEVILSLAENVRLISLSATVSNAEEFGEWLNEVRGGVKVVVSESRPVPLHQHVLAGRKIYDLYNAKHEPNPDLLKLGKAESRLLRDDSRRPRNGRGNGRRNNNYGSGRFAANTNRRFLARSEEKHRLTPSRAKYVSLLNESKLLPAIIFVFSRSGCDAAVRQLLNSDIRLVNRSEANQLKEIANRHLAGFSESDLSALGYGAFYAGLVRGIAAHHAGLLPAFKAIVEDGFSAGLIKAVFATETLALGINMPAKSVVIEKLVKYNGEAHVDVTPGEYTQLTGRAGRRGIDPLGHALVLWNPGMDPRAVAGLAGKRTYPLKSSFTPSYNMAVNLVRTLGVDRAQSLLEQSFAQFQIDKSVVFSARKLAKDTVSIENLYRAAQCSKGDFVEYAQLREQISQLESEAAKARKSDRKAEISAGLLAFSPGDLIWVPGGKNTGWAVVLGAGRPGNPGPVVMTERNQLARLAERDFSWIQEPVSKIKLPKKFDSKSRADRRKVFALLTQRIHQLDLSIPTAKKSQLPAVLAEQITELRARLRDHACHSCPDRESHARFAEQAARLEREYKTVEHKISNRQNSIRRKFDRICSVLVSLGYLTEDGSQVSEQGKMLSRIYGERDLLVAECLRSQVFDQLTPAQFAAVLSGFVYESRISGSRIYRMPDRESERAQSAVRQIWHELGKVERDFQLERTDAPDIGFAEAAYDWASGRDLSDILADTQLSAGDFVRWIRQIIDLANQICHAVGAGELAKIASQTVNVLKRGVVDFDVSILQNDDSPSAD